MQAYFSTEKLSVPLQSKLQIFSTMKTKIFDKLKQGYASLGLGDEFFQAHAEALANLGLVTDENIDSVVGAQKSFLESVQKSNDKRVTDAVSKANKTATEKQTAAEKAAKEKEDALQKQIDELKKQLEKQPEPPTPPTPTKDDEIDEKIKAANAETAKLIASMQEQLKAMQEEGVKSKADIEKLQNEKAELERKQAAAARQAMILAKAKELNIPQSRIDEGFVIAEDADDKAIGDYLTKVAANIKNNSLPTNPHFSMQGKEVTQQDADDIAGKIVP